MGLFCSPGSSASAGGADDPGNLRQDDRGRLQRRLAEVVALQVLDALADEELGVLLRLHAFGHRLHAVGRGEAQEVADEELVVDVARQVAHERAVDLDDVEGERLQVAERGEAGAEVVDRHAAAEVADGREEARGFVDVGQRRGLGDLDDQPLGDVGLVLDQRREAAQPGLVAGRETRDVDREVQLRVVAERLDREVQHVAVDEAYEAELLDDRHEGAGRDDLAALAAHAQQAFVEDRLLVVAGAHDRLEGELQAVLAQCVLDLVADDEVAAVLFALLLGHAVHHEAVAAIPLALLEGSLRLRHRVVGGGAEFGEEDTTDRDGYMRFVALGNDRSLAHRLQDAFGGPRHLPFRALAEHDTEAIGTDAADDVAGAQAAVEALADLDEHGVAGLVAEAVVDLGELVDADDEIAAGNVGAAAVGNGVLERLAQPHLVEVAGQVVEARQPLEAGLVLLARIDEAQAADHAIRRCGGGALGGAAVVDPAEESVVAAHAVFAVIDLAVGEMVGERLQARRQVLGVDAVDEAVAGADRGEVVGAENLLAGTDPGDGVAGQVPVVEEVARGFDGVLQPLELA